MLSHSPLGLLANKLVNRAVFTFHIRQTRPLNLWYQPSHWVPKSSGLDLVWTSHYLYLSPNPTALATNPARSYTLDALYGLSESSITILFNDWFAWRDFVNCLETGTFLSCRILESLLDIDDLLTKLGHPFIRRQIPLSRYRREPTKSNHLSCMDLDLFWNIAIVMAVQQVSWSTRNSAVTGMSTWPVASNMSSLL